MLSSPNLGSALVQPQSPLGAVRLNQLSQITLRFFFFFFF